MISSRDEVIPATPVGAQVWTGAHKTKGSDLLE